MNDLDLDGMSLADLKKLQKTLDKAIETYQERQRREALAAAEAKAREMGFTLADLVNASKGKGAATVSPPKYQHPENPDVTWTGRGRQPDWIKNALAEGRAKEDFLIEK